MLSPDATHVVRRPIEQVLNQFERRLKEQDGWVELEPCRYTELTEVPALGVTYTCGCGGKTRVTFGYHHEDSKPHAITLCAICDAAYLAPRFAKDAA